jgi:hypothetical protein
MAICLNKIQDHANFTCVVSPQAVLFQRTPIFISPTNRNVCQSHNLGLGPRLGRGLGPSCLKPILSNRHKKKPAAGNSAHCRLTTSD